MIQTQFERLIVASGLWPDYIWGEGVGKHERDQLGVTGYQLWQPRQELMITQTR